MTDETQQKVVAAYQIANQGEFDHARMLLEEALYDDSSNIEAWLLLADLAEDRDEALQCYQMVLEVSPGNWIAQQRLKLLLTKPSISAAPAEEPSGMYYETSDRSELLPDLDSFLGDDLDDLDGPPSDKPTLKESFQAHRKLVTRAGIGLAVFVGLLVLTWAGSLLYMAWRWGILIIGG